MGYRQTYKGIFQFKDQATLDLAMAETEAEALEADAMGLQDSFRGEGVMLMNIEARNASDQAWEEMAVAIATLAMHASKGFAYAVAEQDGDRTVEYYEASGGGETPVPANTSTAPAVESDYFPMREGAHFVFRGVNNSERAFDWTTHRVSAHGRDYYYFQDNDAHSVHFSQYWDGTFYYEDKSLIGTVDAGSTEELQALSANDPYSSQIVYNNEGAVGDMLYTIWKHDDVFVILTQDAFENVSVPYGELENCMRVRVEVFKIFEDKMETTTHQQFFAKGIGLVKWQSDQESLVLTEFSASN